MLSVKDNSISKVLQFCGQQPCNLSQFLLFRLHMFRNKFGCVVNFNQSSTQQTNG